MMVNLWVISYGSFENWSAQGSACVDSLKGIRATPLVF